LATQKNESDGGNVRALRQPRILLAASDRRFERVAGFLLARKGFRVVSTGRPADFLAIVERERPDVVILDGSDSLAAAARAVAVIEALHGHVTVFVVADEGVQRAPESLRVFPKWTSLEQLISSIEAMQFGPLPIRVVSS
jgi:DNA-binding NtrC family response regulator